MRDGRYLAIDKFNTGLASLVKAEKLDPRTMVTFAVPSGPAMFLNLARKAFEEARSTDPRKAFGAWQNVLVPTNQTVISTRSHYRIPGHPAAIRS